MATPVGKTVHYVSHGTPVRPDGTQAFTKQCRAAMVSARCDNPNGIDPETGTECVSLVVLNPTGFFFHEHCPYDMDGVVENIWSYKGGTWHYLEECVD